MKPPERVDGYAPIEEYAALSDGRTAALVARDGRVDWWPVPVLDAAPACAALLDATKGGYVAVSPVDPFETERHYSRGTNVLEAVMTTERGAVRVTSALNMAATGRLPWTELAFRVEGLSGEVAMECAFAPGTQLRASRAKTAREQDVTVVRVGTHTMAVLFDGDGAEDVHASELGVGFRVRAGARLVFAVVATDQEPLFLPPLSVIDERLDATKENWRRWSREIDVSGPWAEQVVRSALVLKTLLAEWTGSIAAAATTSLPECVGGSRNWDYRFSWVRDSSFSIDALINLGLSEEVHNAVAWLLKAIDRNGPGMHVFYTLAGGTADDEEHLKVPGYRRSKPVRSGNGAARQLQLGNFGDVFDTVYRYVDGGNVLDVSSQRVLCELADQCCEQWSEPDSGIWELAKQEHYTISKIGCWVALDRATKLAESGQLSRGRPARWRRERDRVRAFIERDCWSEHKRSYTFYAGSDELDAAVLLSARTGFDRGERLVGTIDAVSRELRRGPFVYRYSDADESEGAFVACTFWLVEALAGTGQRDAAVQLMNDAVRLTNDVGILAEEIDPETGAFLGNVPQALSHLALINAAFSLREAATRE